MSETNYRRITDWNHSIHGWGKHTSFEAGFSISEQALFFRGRIIDSNGVEVVCSSDLREFGVEKYQNWNPTADLEYLINAIELQTVESEPAYLQTPMLEMTLEIKGPVASPKVFATTVHMATKFILLGSYEWQDSGCISVSMLCEKQALLEFTRGLQTDLLTLLNKSAV